MNLPIKKLNVTHLSELVYRGIKHAINYSAIKCFAESRKDFYKQYILQEPRIEKETIAKTLGTLIHTLLSGQDIEEKFCIAKCLPPTGQMLELVDNLYLRSLQSLEDGIQKDSWQSIFADGVQKTKYDFDNIEVAFKNKNLEKIQAMFMDSAAELYYREKMDNVGRTVVSVGTITNAENLVERLKSHPYTREYANACNGEGIEVFHELPILFTQEEIEYKCLLDLLVVSHTDKTIKIYDWKSTWDNSDVSYIYLKYGYYLQAALYNKAVQHFAADHGISDYTIAPMCFIFTDSSGYYDPTLLQLSDDDVERAERGMKIRGIKYPGLMSLLEQIQWAISEGCYTTTQELKKNNGIIKLNLAYGSI